FQAEDGIRDLTVTGVQTCALPIFFANATGPAVRTGASPCAAAHQTASCARFFAKPPMYRRKTCSHLVAGVLLIRGQRTVCAASRSEERRVGKECRSRGGGYRSKKK